MQKKSGKQPQSQSNKIINQHIEHLENYKCGWVCFYLPISERLRSPVVFVMLKALMYVAFKTIYLRNIWFVQHSRRIYYTHTHTLDTFFLVSSCNHYLLTLFFHYRPFTLPLATVFFSFYHCPCFSCRCPFSFYCCTITSS